MARPLAGLLQLAVLLAWPAAGSPEPGCPAPPPLTLLPSEGIPTQFELRTNCPAEYKACIDSPPCGRAIDEMDAYVPERSPEFFNDLIRCFQHSSAGQDKRVVQIRHQDTVRRVATDIACDACQLLVEDMWMMLMQCRGHPIKDGTCDVDAVSPEGMRKDPEQGVDAALRGMIAHMCGDPGTVGWRHIGDNYDIHNCSKLDTAAATAACTKSERSGGYVIERDGTGPKDDKQNAGHGGVYSIICRDYIAPNDIDIVEAFGGQYPDPTLLDNGPATGAARKSVGLQGCEEVCSANRKKKKPKKTKKKKAKKKHSSVPDFGRIV